MKHPLPADIIAEGEARDRLDLFSRLLLKWNARINLVSRADEPDLWHRHILDSAQLVPLLPTPPGVLIDLGSGGGFPGLVLAILTSWEVHLVEADRRKAAFLREAARVTGSTVSVHAVRAEGVRIAPGHVVCARAVAPIADLLTLAAPLLLPGGICLFPKGEGVEDELTAAASRWHMRIDRVASRTRPGATVLRISNMSRAGHFEQAPPGD